MQARQQFYSRSPLDVHAAPKPLACIFNLITKEAWKVDRVVDIGALQLGSGPSSSPALLYPHARLVNFNLFTGSS